MVASREWAPHLSRYSEPAPFTPNPMGGQLAQPSTRRCVLHSIYCCMYFTTLSCIILKFNALYFTVLHCSVLYCNALHCTVQDYTTVYRLILYCRPVQVCAVLYSVVLSKVWTVGTGNQMPLPTL